MSNIPACRDCSYYYHNGFYDICGYHTVYQPDYINGKIHKTPMLALVAREDENRCGPEGKDFKQSGN